jgi:hypothetical protein
MKNLILFALLVISKLLTAQPVKLYIDINKEDKKPPNKSFSLASDEYYIIFSTHDKFHSNDPNVNSFAGHAWVFKQSKLKLVVMAFGQIKEY